MSDFRVRGLFAFVVLVCMVSLPGCSGKSPITITLTPSGQPACGTNSSSACSVTLSQGGSIAIAASVANDSTNAGVTWSLGSSVGTLSSQTTTSVTYVAPVAITANTTATITATSIANTSVTATVSVTINAVFGFESASLPIATVGIPYNGVIATDGATGPFTWIIISGSLPAGLTLSNSDTASVNITGTPTTTGTSSVTIQATDGAGTPISRTFTITVNPPPALTITTTSLPGGTVNTPYPSSSSPGGFTLQASFGTPPYTWSIVSGTGSLPAGLTLSSSGVISGTPTTVGTSSFTVQVQDSATPNPATATRSLSITITQVVVNSELSGNYAFLVSGYDVNGGRFMAAGSFVANGSAGTITSGLMDINDAGSVQQSVPFNGSYLIGTNGLGTMAFAGRTFALSFIPTGNPSIIQSANLIEFDGIDQDSGVLVQQNTGDFSTSAISGAYAFGFLGVDPTRSRYALAGEFQADGSGNLTSGMLDSDDASSGPAPSVSITSGSYSVASNGRGTMVITTAQGSTNYSFYVVSNAQLLVIEIDQVAGQTRPVVSGTALLQASSLTLNAASVFETTAEPTVSGSLVAQAQVGVLTTTGSAGSGTLTLSSDLNTNGTASTGASQSGTYSLAANGRAALTNSGFQTSDPVLYLVNSNQAFIVGTDPAVTFGYMTPQTGPFTSSSLSGTYAGGTVAPVLLSGINQLDVVTANPSASPPLTFITDVSSTSGLSQDQTSTQT
ncbi:MAG TPA: Ig domain-containing protein, partial [Terriglobales bacterium]|nr:Ig domain-containing protein [Terriglobales bacterium]